MAKKMLIAAALTLCLGSAAHADGHWHGGGGWHGGWHEDRGFGGFGGGILGGIIGGAVGSIFSPPVVVAPPVYVQPIQPVPEIIPGSPAWYQYCQNKYRSWDGSSYLGFDGQRHPCV